jgi:hypothetical protein
MKQVPEWFTYMAKDAKLDAKEVVALFGFSNVVCLHGFIFRGKFPRPDGGKQKTTTHGVSKLCCWSKELILEEIKKRKEIAGAISRD